MDDNSIRENIRNLRKNLHFTQQDMAERIGISRVAYANLETGITRIFNVSIEKIAKAGNISIEELLLGFLPEKDNTAILEQYQETYNRQVDEYENRLAEKNREMEQLKDHIATLKDSIRTKDDIIKLLKARKSV